tara:strand:- start:219 stop:491 length:273 start_codon:yes stop_codon:yes gene_type:complete
MVKAELLQLQNLNIKNTLPQIFNASDKYFENYLVNFFSFDEERIIAGFSRFGNKYKVYLGNKNKVKNRQEKDKEFTNFVKAKTYLLELTA